MDIFQEPIPYQNPDLHLKIWNFTHTGLESVTRPAWHYHKEVEFIYVLEGVHQMYTPDHAYTLHAGQAMVIGSSQLHRGLSVGKNLTSYLVLHVQFEPYFDPAMMRYSRHFMEVLEPLEALNYIFQSQPDVQSEVGLLMVRIHEEMMAQQKGYEIAVSMHIKHLLLLLLRGDVQGKLTAHEAMDSNLLQPVLSYIEDNLAAKIDMAEASRIASMSYAYFSKYFKSKLGISFNAYVNRKRIAKAERLLAAGDKSLTEIACEVGIENMSHFYELFKRTAGCTPKQYREKMRRAETSGRY